VDIFIVVGLVMVVLSFVTIFVGIIYYAFSCHNLDIESESNVFCKDCKYFDYEYFIEDPFERCMHPENKKVKKSYRNEYFEYKKSPKKINKRNNCKWFLKDK